MQGRVQYQNNPQDDGLYFYDFNVQAHDQKQEILAGLKQSPKTISAKYFYDKTGSQLFEAITCLPEYYPTRTEINLLRQNHEQILNLAGQQCVLIEYGSGASTTHWPRNLPTLIAGGSNMGLQHGTYWQDGETIMSNVYLSILRSMGIQQQSFADSTGVLSDSLCSAV